jgi:hypothetical protein
MKMSPEKVLRGPSTAAVVAISLGLLSMSHAGAATKVDYHGYAVIRGSPQTHWQLDRLRSLMLDNVSSAASSQPPMGYASHV